MIIQVVETVKVRILLTAIIHIWALSKNDSSSYSVYAYTCVDSNVCSQNKHSEKH